MPDGVPLAGPARIALKQCSTDDRSCPATARISFGFRPTRIAALWWASLSQPWLSAAPRSLLAGHPGRWVCTQPNQSRGRLSPELLKRQPALLTLLGDPMSPQHTLRRLSFGIQASGNGQRRLTLERPSQRRLSLARQEPNTLLLCRGRELFEEGLRKNISTSTPGHGARGDSDAGQGR